MSKFSCYDFEKTLLDNFEEDFVENLLDYITKIDFNKFVRGLLKNLKTTIAYIEQARGTQGNIVVDNLTLIKLLQTCNSLKQLTLT